MVTKNIDKTKIVNTIYSFFEKFKSWCGPSATTPTVQELEKYLSKDLQMYNNGQLIVKGGDKYLERLQKFQKKYSSLQMSKPLENPLVYENQVVLYYQIDVTTRSGEKKQIFLMGIFTIEDDKISRWVEVTNEKGVGNWDS